MQAKYIVAMAIGSFALGAAAVQTLHAAASPPAYVIGEITVKDEDGYKNVSQRHARQSSTLVASISLAGSTRP